MTPRPARLEGDRSGLTITWNDGHESFYPARALRLACQCAECVDEWTRQPRIHEETIPDDVFIEAGDPVGNYAVRFHWSDGHDTGIYSFTFLRGACPCEECAAQRAVEGPGPRV